MPFESPRGRSQVSETRSVPAPVGGLNYRDSAAAMPATDALRMLNFQPLPYAVALRKGWAVWGGAYPAPIFTIINHIIERSSSGQHVLVFSDGNLYVQTFPNDPVPTPLSSSVGGRYEHASLRNDAGTLFTYMVSVGLDPIVYQGTAGPPPTSTLTVVSQSMVNPPVAPLDIYGVDPKKFLNIALHKNRLWFVETASTNAWYLADGAVGGEAKKYPLGGVFSKGGTLQ